MKTRIRSVLASGWLLMLFTATGWGAGARWGEYSKKSDDWFRGDDGRRVTANVLSHQSKLGSWPKNLDTSAALFSGDAAKLQGTFDNGATTGELRFLARAFRVECEPKSEAAFLKGFDHILQAQYPNGGWPQFYPPGSGYHRHISFNDDTMVRLMEFLREVATSPAYEFVDAARRKAAQESFDRGVQCILKCQVKVEGRLTGWCAQHDEKDFSPRPARAYELVSLSGAESAGLMRLLMSLDRPRAEVIQSVRAARDWFETARLSGIKVIQVEDAKAPRGRDKVVVQDSNSRPIWARFYEIGSNKPIFSDRDGVAKSSLADLGYERRNGYVWFGYWPESILAKEFPAWEKKWKVSD